LVVSVLISQLTVRLSHACPWRGMVGGYQPASPPVRVSQVIAGNSPVLCRHLPEALASGDVAPFLQAFGFSAQDASQWLSGAALPRLTLRVLQQSKVDGFTYYHVECTLARPESCYCPYLAWRSLRRLSQLRGGLHDPVKQALGRSYRQEFQGTPFASRYGLADVTERLNCWCRRLADVIGAGRAPPSVVAVVLQVLGGPDVASAAAKAAQDGAAVPEAKVEFPVRHESNVQLVRSSEETVVKPVHSAPEPCVMPEKSLRNDTRLGSLMSAGAVEFVIGEEVERIGIVLDRLPPAEHLLVQTIRDDTPAALQGLTVGSKLLAVNGRSVAELEGEEFSLLLRETRPLVLLFLQCSAVSPSGLQMCKLDDLGEDASDAASGCFSEAEPEEEVESFTEGACFSPRKSSSSSSPP